MEEKSGVKFDQARVALARQWIGEVLHEEEVQKEITLRVAVASTEGLVVNDKTPALTETVPIPKSAEEARRIVSSNKGRKEFVETVRFLTPWRSICSTTVQASPTKNGLELRKKN